MKDQVRMMGGHDHTCIPAHRCWTSWHWDSGSGNKWLMIDTWTLLFWPVPGCLRGHTTTVNKNPRPRIKTEPYLFPFQVSQMLCSSLYIFNKLCSHLLMVHVRFPSCMKPRTLQAESAGAPLGALTPDSTACIHFTTFFSPQLIVF